MNIDYFALCNLAYVDPGAGGFLFQILFFFFSALVAFLAAGKERTKQFLTAVARKLGIKK